MTIRAYQESDWGTVRDIYDLAKPDEMRGSVDLRAILPLENNPAHLVLFRDSTILVFEEAGRVVGFGGYKGNYIAWVFVHPAHRRKGIARALTLDMLTRLDGTITLNVGKHNRAARELYETLGFVIAQECIANFNGHDVDVLKLKYERAPTGG